MARPAQFAKRIRDLGRTVEVNSSNLVKKVSTAILETLVPDTPVKTGQARSNWQVNLDTAAVGVVPVKDQTGDAAIRDGSLTIAGYSSGKNTSVHITNNLPYINKLNEGSSKQAPAAFVEAAILTGANAIDGTKILR